MTKSPKGSQGIAKRGDIYWARFRLNGKLIQKSLATRNLREAKRKYRKLRQSSTPHSKGSISPSQETTDWDTMKYTAFRYLKNRISEKQYQDYERSFTLYEGACNPKRARDLTESALLLFCEKRQKDGASPRTINKQVGHILASFRIAREMKSHSLVSPTYIPLRHTPEKERRSLTIEEIGKLLEATKRPQERLLWLTALKTGMRKNELVELKWKHLRRDHIALPGKGTKSRKSRQIPLPCDFIKQLRRERQHRDYVFVNTAGNPWRNNLLTRFYVRCDHAGIADGQPGGSVDIHSLRVTFVTQAIEAGCDPRSVQEIVGHSTVELTLSVYTKSTDSAKRRVSERLPY